MFYIAQYPVRWTAQSALHFSSPWQTCSFQHQLYFSWKHSSQAAMPNLRNCSKGDSNPDSLDCESGILPRSTQFIVYIPMQPSNSIISICVLSLMPSTYRRALMPGSHPRSIYTSNRSSLHPTAAWTKLEGYASNLLDNSALLMSTEWKPLILSYDLSKAAMFPHWTVSHNS